MTADTPLPVRPARALRDALAAGNLSAVALTQACLDRIAAREDTVQAFAWIDAEHALAQARALDAQFAEGGPIGPLHGLPVGVKDIIDTADMPTENGCPADAGRRPDRDALLVTRLRAAGAVVLGKTVTTELAFLCPSKTRNPHDPGHTPGGSSSGSAAAVADGMLPLAIGTQTGGSVVRPASFCGVAGYKPSFDAIPKAGVLVQSPSLDTIGTFAREPDGAALLAGVLMQDLDVQTGCAPAADMPEPRFTLVHPPGWDAADPALHDAFAGFCAALGARVTPASLPPLFADAAARRAVINGAEMAHHFARYMTEGEDAISTQTRGGITEGQQVSATDYLDAMDRRAAMPGALAPLLASCDAILCPAALGPAPEGLSSTGDSIFNGLWTMAGTPCITLPLLRAPNGLPMGVQLVGAVGADAALLRTAGWLWRRATAHLP